MAIFKSGRKKFPDIFSQILLLGSLSLATVPCLHRIVPVFHFGEMEHIPSRGNGAVSVVFSKMS